MKEMGLIFGLAACFLLSACSGAGKKNERAPAQTEIGDAGFPDNSQKKCAMAAMDAVFNSQVQELKLNKEDKAKFAINWYGDMINNDPDYQKAVQQIKIICARAFIMAAPIETSAIGDKGKSRQLLCDGALSILINPTQKSLHVADDGDHQNLKKASLSKFDQLRNGPDTYEISGKVLYRGQNLAISVRTSFRPDQSQAEVNLGDQQTLLACQSQVLPNN